jgi:hypothetical protein
MNTPQFLINALLEEHKRNYSDNLADNITKLKKTLYEKGILTKEYLEDNLMLLYHKYDSPITTELERECRSLVIDLTTLKIKSYSCESPRLNKDGSCQELLANSTEKQIITTCYEGTYLSLFHHNDKWYNSTRRCLDSNKSIFTNGDTQVNLSHFNMFEEILKKAGYDNFDDFCSKLDKNKSYYFVLIHHKNKHIIDYSSQFGKEYACACLTSIRDENMCELDIYNNQDLVNFIVDNTYNSLFLSPKHDSIESFYELNKNCNYDFTVVPESEGIIIRVWSNTLQKYNLIKLQNANYQLAQVVGTEQNIFKGILYLYQIDKLANYFENNSENNFNKIVNPINTTETYNTVGIVDAVFKVCTSELFVLFKLLWSLKDGKQQNKYLYNILPKEYKDILFGIKGLYYKKKSLNYNNKDSKDSKSYHLKLSDIYNYLKNLPIEQLIAFIHMRKLMFNWSRLCSNENLALKDFNTISMYCNNVHIKLCAIFTHKLYPNIMPTDVPQQKTVPISVPVPVSIPIIE